MSATITDAYEYAVLRGYTGTQEDFSGLMALALKYESTSNKDLGIVTAYGYARANGYTGTESEFGQLMASYAIVAEAAAQSKSDAEAYSVGTRDGEPVSSDDPAYENNAKYYSEQATTAAEDAETSASTFTTDKTLSVTDKAADGKATGDAINNLMAAVGTPLVATLKSGMTNHDKIYVYTGSETGMNTGHWYFWDGTDWSDGGVYQAASIPTDKTLTVADMAADAEVVGSELTDLKSTIINYSELYVDGEMVVSPNYLNKNSSGGKPTTDSANRLISEKILVPPGAIVHAKRNTDGTVVVIYRFDNSDTLIETIYATGTGIVVNNCDHIRVYIQYVNNDDINPTDGLLIAEISFVYKNPKIGEYVTPEMFSSLGVEESIEAAIATGLNVLATAKEYTLSRGIQINGCSNQIIDFSAANIIYTGTDYAFEFRECENIDFKFKQIEAMTGSIFCLIGESPGYCQYLNFSGLVLKAKYKAFYATANTGSWVNEIRCKMFRISGNTQNAFYLDATDGGNINTWRLFNISFEGVVTGLLLFNSNMHVIESCRYDENITRLINATGRCTGLKIFGSYKVNTSLFILSDQSELTVNSPITFHGTNQTHYFGLFSSGEWSYDGLFVDTIPNNGNYNYILKTNKYRVTTDDYINTHAPDPNKIKYGYLIVQNLLNTNTCTQVFVNTYITDEYPYAFAIRTKSSEYFQPWKYVKAE